jgi:hypothetical protein
MEELDQSFLHPLISLPENKNIALDQDQTLALAVTVYHIDS